MGRPVPLYLGENFSAGFTAPTLAGHDDYVSDPAKPVPFSPRPIDMNDRAQWTTWLVRDQRFVSGRPDVIEYRTAALDKPVHIMGAPQVELFAATTGTDSDWVVKLIDVYPDTSPEAASQGSKPSMAGYQLPIGIEIFRGRYVHSLSDPKPLTSGKGGRGGGARPGGRGPGGRPGGRGGGRPGGPGGRAGGGRGGGGAGGGAGGWGGRWPAARAPTG